MSDFLIGHFTRIKIGQQVLNTRKDGQSPMSLAEDIEVYLKENNRPYTKGDVEEIIATIFCINPPI
jgi:hypothetical protein